MSENSLLQCYLKCSVGIRMFECIFEMHQTVLCSVRFRMHSLLQSQEILFFLVSPSYLGHLLTPNVCVRTALETSI